MVFTSLLCVKNFLLVNERTSLQMMLITLCCSFFYHIVRRENNSKLVIIIKKWTHHYYFFILYQKSFFRHLFSSSSSSSYVTSYLCLGKVSGFQYIIFVSVVFFFNLKSAQTKNVVGVKFHLFSLLWQFHIHLLIEEFKICFLLLIVVRILNACVYIFVDYACQMLA